MGQQEPERNHSKPEEIRERQIAKGLEMLTQLEELHSLSGIGGKCGKAAEEPSEEEEPELITDGDSIKERPQDPHTEATQEVGNECPSRK